MAIVNDTGESFLREVDENLRRDQLEQKFKRYSGWLVGALILFLAAAGGFIWWQSHQRAEAAADSEKLSAVMTDIGGANLKTVPQRLDELADSDSKGIRAAALLTRADVALQQNDRKGAADAYRKVAADSGLPQPYRDLATIRLTEAEFDSITPDEAISRLQPLAQAGNPWFGSAGELTALAMLKQNRKAEAGRLFAQIARDPAVPASLRDRAQQIAGTLGVDVGAVAPLPR